jgi:copper chaperone NosL
MAAPSAHGVTRASLVLAMAVLSAGCGGDGPREIAWGREECAACRMRIIDQRFAAQLVTTRGKSYSFDAVECLLGFLDRGELPPAEVRSLWVANGAAEGALIDARTARYLRSPDIRSPMGFGVMAFATDPELAAGRAVHGGDALTWEQLPALRRAPAGPGRPARAAGAVPPP